MDIKQWAKLNNLTPEQFKNEIVDFMAALGSLEIDQQDGKDMVVWTVSDSKSVIQVMVRRVEPAITEDASNE